MEPFIFQNKLGLEKNVELDTRKEQSSGQFIW